MKHYYQYKKKWPNWYSKPTFDKLIKEGVSEEEIDRRSLRHSAIKEKRRQWVKEREESGKRIKKISFLNARSEGRSLEDLTYAPVKSKRVTQLEKDVWRVYNSPLLEWYTSKNWMVLDTFPWLNKKELGKILARARRLEKKNRI